MLEKAPLDLNLPWSMGQGNRSAEKRAKRDAAVKAWCEALLKLKEQVKDEIDYDPGARGWCYLMEEHGLSKDEFDKAEALITACRKDGSLPLDFCGDDDVAREFSNIEELDESDPIARAREIVEYVNEAEDTYDPVSFWDYQDCYVQMTVEKVGLKNLFDPVCAEFHVPLGNMRGSSSLWQRIKLMKWFAEAQAEGKRCILLTCGDHDIHGLRISRDLRANLEALMGAFEREFPYLDLDLDAVEIVRFGLNPDFIAKHGLTWTHGLKTGGGKDLGDPNHKHHHHRDVQAYIAKFGERKVEADAMVKRARVSRALCRRAILQYLDEDGITEFEQARQQKRDELRQEIDRRLGKATEDDDGGAP